MRFEMHDLALASLEPLKSTIDTVVAELRAAARDAADASKAPATERAYASDWRDFRAFTVCRPILKRSRFISPS